MFVAKSTHNVFRLQFKLCFQSYSKKLAFFCQPFIHAKMVENVKMKMTECHAGSSYMDYNYVFVLKYTLIVFLLYIQISKPRQIYRQTRRDWQTDRHTQLNSPTHIPVDKRTANLYLLVPVTSCQEGYTGYFCNEFKPVKEGT